MYHYKLIDLFSFILTTTLVIGSVLAIAIIVRKCSAAVDSTKSSLEKRGWKVSSHGMSVPVGKRSVVDREHYLDATQRGLSKAANASTFGGSPHMESSALRTSLSSSSHDEHDADHRHHRLHLFKRHMD
ncbi:hypothetical protein EI94DRAFT_1805888 [Lactarius quietus]|nr:hypothetical protein EI94DRAFT_1805888 [Lactarius quietus]